MLRIFSIVLIFAGNAWAQADKTQTDVFKKEAAELQAAIYDAVNSQIPGPDGILERPRAAYLEGYGVVVSLQLTFGPAFNIFSGRKPPAEVRRIVAERKRLVHVRIQSVLKEHIAKMQSVADGASLSVAVHILNSNPADVPDLPEQILFTVKKQDPIQVTSREF